MSTENAPFSPDSVFDNWDGIKSNFAKTICQTFGFTVDDEYLYRAESIAMTLADVQEKADKLKYKYQSHGKQIEVVSGQFLRFTV